MIDTILKEGLGNKTPMILNGVKKYIDSDKIDEFINSKVSVKIYTDEIYIDSPGKNQLKYYRKHMINFKVKENLIGFEFKYFDSLDSSEVNFSLIMDGIIFNIINLIYEIKNNIDNTKIANSRTNLSIQLNTDKYKHLEKKFNLEEINYIEKNDLLNRLEKLLQDLIK